MTISPLLVALDSLAREFDELAADSRWTENAEAAVVAAARAGILRRAIAQLSSAPAFDVEGAVDLLRDTAELADNTGHPNRAGDAIMFRDVATFLTAINPSPPATSNAPDAELLAALEPFAFFWRQWSRQPMRQMDDVIYAIHSGTEYEAALRRSDCRRASDLLLKIAKQDAP